MIKNYLKKNKLYIFIFITAAILGIFLDFSSADVGSNKEVIKEGFRWARLIKIALIVGGWNLINHYFFKDKK